MRFFSDQVLYFPVGNTVQSFDAAVYNPTPNVRANFARCTVLKYPVVPNLHSGLVTALPDNAFILYGYNGTNQNIPAPREAHKLFHFHSFDDIANVRFRLSGSVPLQMYVAFAVEE